MDPVGSHEVGGLDGADDDELVGLVTSAITHNTNTGNRQEHGEDLASRAVEIRGADFLDEDFVSLAELL